MEFPLAQLEKLRLRQQQGRGRVSPTMGRPTEVKPDSSE